MLYIQSLDRYTSQPSPKQRQTSEYDINRIMFIKTHRNYSTLASQSQSKKKKMQTYINNKQAFDQNLPEKNIFTSRGIMESSKLETANKKVTFKNHIKYKKKEKCSSMCNNLVFNPSYIPRVKTPKILIKSVFNFNRGQRKYTNSLGQDGQINKYRRSPRKPPTDYSHLTARKRMITLGTHQRNQFIGWETQAIHDYEYNL